MRENNNDEQLRLVIFVVFCGIILFGWQYFFAPQEAPREQLETVQSVAPEQTNTHKDGHEKTDLSFHDSSMGDSTEPENEIVIEGQGQKYYLTSSLRFRDVQNEQVPFTYKSTIGDNGYFQFFLKKEGRVIRPNFKIKEHYSPSHVLLEDSALAISLDFNLNDEGMMSFSFNSLTPYNHSLIINTEKKELANKHIREFLVHTSAVDRYSVGKEDKGADLVKWVALDFNYHLLAIIFKEKTSSSFGMSETGKLTLVENSPSQKLDGKIIFTNKNYDKLVALGDNLKLSVDFGILGVLTVPILKGLQWFYNFIPNYGISIIILTFILRLLTFPLQFKSFKSMKKMQEVQPEMNKIREKFKDDPQKMQQETMALFKRVGANPLSGCFPILLQMPIFIAFYKVLSSAMELVGAPFFLWIHDLSLKDPYYLLPVLVTATFFIQQKMTPTTTVDPTQKKIMMIMPLFFGFIMKDLPAGLNLYMFVSSFLGIFQQLFVYRLRS